MNQVARRSTIALLLVVILIIGMALFLLEYVTKAGDWAVFSGNPHVYNGLNIGCGTITDRSGTVLLTADSDWTYAEDAELRKATIHWLGDRQGYISAPAVSYYAEEMAGYDLVNGLYAYSGTGGEAVMTISAEAQLAALEALGSRSGTVAVYNYKTGEILCAVTTPTYDPDNVPDIAGDDSGAYEGVYLNRFTQATYVPGSIFKVVTSAAALEKLDHAEELTFECTSSYSMAGGKVTCERAHGSVDMKRALAKSCNCYFAQLSELLGGDTLEEYVEAFRVTQSVTFDGITTARGSFDIQGAMAQEIAWSSIGQHLDLVNPCAFMTFMGAIAGGGSASQPYIVAEVSSGGLGGYSAAPETTGRIMSAETAQLLQQMLRNNVVSEYGADNFPGLTVCGKSGTAQVGGDKKPNATFAGFVADEEYPLAFIVVVENGGSGAGTCVPILSQVLEVCKDVLDSE